MGNWAAALEGAASGLDSMTKLKMTEAELAYKEMAEQNRMRWQTDEAKKERDWKSSENFIDRDWRSEEAGTEREWKSGESELDREVKREDLALGRERLDEDREYRRGVLADRERRTDAYSEKTTGGWTEENENEATLEALKNLDEEEAEISNATLMNATEKEAKLKNLQQRRDRIIDYGATGAVAYERVNKVFAGHPDGQVIAETYARMSPEQRKQVDQEYLKLRKQKMGAAEAYGEAVWAVQNSGRPTDATDIKSSSNTDLNKSVEGDFVPEPESDMPPNTGDVQSTKGPEEVAAANVAAPKKDEFIGPPAPPKPTRERPQADTTVPAYEAAKPIREKTGKMQQSYKDRDAGRITQAAKQWLETNEVDSKQLTLMKRMHTKKELASVLKDAGYSENMVDKFLQYIYG